MLCLWRGRVESVKIVKRKKKNKAASHSLATPETSGKMLKCDFSAIFTRAQVYLAPLILANTNYASPVFKKEAYH